MQIALSDRDSNWKKPRVLVAGGTPPNIFAMPPPLYPDWPSRGVLLKARPWVDAASHQPGARVAPVTRFCGGKRVDLSATKTVLGSPQALAGSTLIGAG